MPTLPEAAPLPHWFYLDIGNLCNLKCPYCPTGNGQVKRSDKGLMSRENFDIIVEKISPYAEFVGLYNWGEPFLNRSLLHMASSLAQRGVTTHIDSNLSLRDFSDREAEDIVSSGLSSIFASIDGVSQEAYEKYRVEGRVDRALNNLRQLVAAKKRLGSDKPGLLWAFYLNRHNEHEVDRARAVAEEIGVEIWFKQLSCPDEFQTSLVNDPSLFAAPASMSSMHWPQVNRKLPEFQLHSTLSPICRQPFTICVINWDGRVSPCCAVASPEFSVGSLLDHDFEEVWNGEMMRSCRKFLADFGPVQGGQSICEKVCTQVPSFAPE